ARSGTVAGAFAQPLGTAKPHLPFLRRVGTAHQLERRTTMRPSTTTPNPADSASSSPSMHHFAPFCTLSDPPSNTAKPPQPPPAPKDTSCTTSENPSKALA